MVSLDRQDDALELALDLAGQGSFHLLAKGLDRPLNKKAVPLHRLHVRLDDVDEQHVFAGASQIGSQRPADGTCTPDQNGVLLHCQFSISARVSSIATAQMAFMSSSDRWK